MRRVALLWAWLVWLVACGSSATWAPPPIGTIPLPPPPGDSVEQGPGDLADDWGLEAVDLIPRKVLFGNPDRAAPRISPDGKQLAFLAPDEGVLNIWVAPVGDLAAAKAVTRDRKRGIHRFFWAYTSQDIVYLQDKAGDENWRAYRVRLSDLDELDLSPFDGVKTQIQQVSHRHPHEILIGLNDRDKRFHDVHRVDIRDGKRSLVQRNDQAFGSFVTDDDYRVRFAVKPLPDGGEQMLRKQGAAFVPFATIDMEDSLTTHIVGFDATGKQLYMLDSRGRDTGALTRRTLPAGAPEIVSSHDKADVADALIHPTTKVIQAAAADHLRKHWTFLDPAVAADFAVLRKVARGDVEVSSRSLDDQLWTVAFVSDRGPVRYYLYDRKTRQATFLFVNRKDLEGLILAPMRPVIIQARDGLELVSYLTLPLGTTSGDGLRPDEPLPMVLFVHGGPWSRDNWGYNSFHQWLANRGYAVLSVNFRGSTGFGKAFVNAGNGQWAGTMHDDLLDAVAWAIAEGIAQPNRVAIMGGSYGGYATLVGLTFSPKRFACGVDIVGPSNLVTLLQSIPPYWASYQSMFKKRLGDHTTEAGRKELLARSPLTRAERIVRPLLIGQGANDPRVKQAESDQLVGAMQAKKIPVTYVLFPDEGHGFRKPENMTSFQAVAELFLADCLGGKAQPLGDDLRGSSLQVPVGADEVSGLAAALKAK
ncbi:MAG: S9 family peptidase [Deltaproteobacteria bacterium]|nr:S9 family peptidase [Deltaproteobacteria bacterium]